MPDDAPVTPAIALCGVTAVALRDPDRVVIENADWSVAPGDFWVVAGLHGSGKSDFLTMIAGLTPPKAGEYRLLGVSMPPSDEADRATRLRLGLVFEEGRMLSHLSIAENIALPLSYHRQLPPEAVAVRVKAMLELTGLTPWADAMPGAVPRIWQKRGGLARALIMEPDILLLDNPLSGLDLRQSQWWLRFLARLSRGDLQKDLRPPTLVVTTEHLRVWGADFRKYAFLNDRRFSVLGGWDAVERSSVPVVREMLTGAFDTGKFENPPNTAGN
jgi:ABC-type transporter Mla maintaining outer membrane lipid asymmetry ATPase subunit MlaF